jgi:hypothetical protein
MPFSAVPASWPGWLDKKSMSPSPTGLNRSRMLAGGLAAIAGLALVLIATNSGRTRDISKHSLPYHLPNRTPATPPPQANPTATTAPPTTTNQGSVPGWVHILLITIGIALGVAIATLAVLYVVKLLRGLDLHRSTRNEPNIADVELAPEDVARALTEAVDETLIAIERGETREAIIACWLRLEDIAGEAGVSRRPAETASDLTERVLATYQVSAATLSRLADLYREARFSAHRLDDTARDEARSALEQVRDELRHQRKTADEPVQQ